MDVSMLDAAKNSTRFSIIVPTYNSAETLPQTLESIRIQQWPNVEVLVIDGLSTDQTVSSAKAFNELEIVIISEPDKGIYDAINKGIARATGDLICIIGSDDRLAAGALVAVDAIWRIQDTDIIAGEALLEAPDGATNKRIDEPYGLGALISGIPFCHNSMYVTPDAYRKVGGYNLDYRICADADWVHRSIRAGCTCSRIAQPLVHFSLNGTSSTNDALIMAETYAVIAGNFPGLSVNDAEILFKAVRRWTDDSLIEEVLSKHQTNNDLSAAVTAGLYPPTASIAAASAALPGNSSFLAKVLRKTQRFFRSRVASN